MTAKNEGSHMWKAVLNYAVVTAVSASITFGATQYSGTSELTRKIDAITSELPHIKESITELKADKNSAHVNISQGYKDADKIMSDKIEALRLENQERIRNITDLLKELVKQNQELISLIKAQQQVTK